MPYTPEEKKKAATRLKRIRGQAEALERAVEAGTECSALLQQVAALRGAVNGLMSEILESHVRETFAKQVKNSRSKRVDDIEEEVDMGVNQVLSLVRSYLK